MHTAAQVRRAAPLTLDIVGCLCTDEGRKQERLLAIQMPSKARTVVGGGKESLPCDPGSELQLGGRGREKKSEDNIGKKNEEKINQRKQRGSK